MGEMADYMLNGDDCEGCGMYLGGGGSGFPRYCSKQCADDRGAGMAQVVGNKQPAARRRPNKAKGGRK